MGRSALGWLWHRLSARLRGRAPSRQEDMLTLAHQPVHTWAWARDPGALAACARIELHRIVAAAEAAAPADRLLAWAALGDVRAAEAAKRLTVDVLSAAQRRTLAQSLAAFDARLALQVLGEADTDPAAQALRLALSLRLGLERVPVGIQSPPSPDVNLALLCADPAQASAGREALDTALRLHALAPLTLDALAAGLSVPALRAAKAVVPIAGPLVSVLMTTFNSADRVAHALCGLLGQTWRNLEVVVVDDASTDATAAVVRALAAQDARIKFIQLPRNVGTYAAKTIGYHHASGDFITCHDSDDWSHPQRIERQMVPLMKDARLVATMSSWVRITDDGRFYARGVYPLIRLNPASALFRRREVEARAGLWDAVRTGADSEFNARLPLVFGPRAIGRVKALLTFGAHREGSLMTASDTGYSPQGLSPARLAYTEAWTLWHIAELRAGRVPRMPDARSGERPFALPPGATPVSAEVVRSAMAGATLG